MERILYAIPDLCTGCSRCVYACSAVKTGSFFPSRARIHVNNFGFNGYSVPSICFQCPKPDCLQACPENAIYKDASGIVQVAHRKCNGCGDCVTACPYGMIEQDDDRLAFKCDYCGGDPACVRECEPGAIVFKPEESQTRRLRALQMKQRVSRETAAEKRFQLGRNLMEMASHPV